MGKLKNSRIYIVMLLTILSLRPFWTQCQDYVHKNYDVPDGLPSSETYHCLQDSKGYIWIATDNGVSRFDGYKFDNFDAQDGLFNSTVFDIYEDYQGRVWFITLSGRLYYYQNSKISAYKYNSVIDRKIVGYRLPVKQSFYVDSLDNVYFSIIRNGISRISSTGKYSNFNGINLSDLNDFKALNSKVLLSGYNSNDFIYSVLINDRIIDREISHAGFKTSSLLFAVKGDKDEIYLCFDNSIYFIKNENIQKLKSFEKGVLWFSKDKFGRYWLSVRNQGIMCFEKPDFGGVPTMSFLQGKDVSSVLIDNENAYWFSTLTEGVFYVPSDKIKCLDIPDYNAATVLSIGVSPESVWLGLNNGEILNYKKNFDKIIRKITLKKNDKPMQLLYQKSWKKLIIGALHFNYTYGKDGLKELIEYKDKNNKSWVYNRSIKCLIPGSGDYFFAGTNYGIDKLDQNTMYYSTYNDSVFNKTVYALYENTDKSIWIGTGDGLGKLENNKYQNWGKKNPLLTSRISTISKYQNKLVLGTKGAGLQLMDLSDFKVKSISMSDGLSSNYILTIAVRENEIWLGTNQGINKIQFLTDSTYQISRLDVGTGLVSDEINQLVLDDSMLYVATKRGFNYINLNQFKWTTEKPRLHFENIKIDYRDTTLLSHFDFKYFQNNIEFSYVGISYKSNKNILYKYRLFPIEDKWNNTFETRINYSILPPGDYKFMIKARNENGIWSDTDDSISFSIDKPFWQKWWFYLFPFSVLMMLIYIPIYSRIEKLKHQNKLKKELNEYMKKAFTLMVNDHFLFNSLNSLNLLILSGDKTESSKMLSRISNYFRAVLFSVKKDFISLSDEINMIKIYLEIEKQRLKDKFHYNLQISRDLNLHELFIPGVVIQPFIESSIWSGTMTDFESVKLDIDIAHDKGLLIISIHTNKKDKPLQNDQNGNKLNLERLENIADSIEKRARLINEFYNWNIQVEYINSTDESTADSGKRILIKLEIDKMRKGNYLPDKQ